MKTLTTTIRREFAGDGHNKLIVDMLGMIYTHTTNDTRLTDRMMDDDEDVEIAAKKEAIELVLDKNEGDYAAVRPVYSQRFGDYFEVDFND